MSGVKESDAGIYNNAIIDFVTIIIMIIIVYKYIFCYRYREAIHNQTCENLLYHAVFLFRIKSNQTNIVLQFPERGFNSRIGHQLCISQMPILRRLRVLFCSFSALATYLPLVFENCHLHCHLRFCKRLFFFSKESALVIASQFLAFAS